MKVLAATNPLLPNGTFIAELIAFLIVLAILWRYVVPKMRQIMDDRQEMIRKQVEESKEAEKRLASAKADYDKSMEEARVNASKIRDDARAQGHQIVEELREKAQSDSDRIIARGHEQLSAERQRLVREIRSEMGEMSVQLASRIVGESLADEARRKGTVDKFLSEVSANGSASANGNSSGSKDTASLSQSGTTGSSDAS